MTRQHKTWHDNNTISCNHKIKRLDDDDNYDNNDDEDDDDDDGDDDAPPPAVALEVREVECKIGNKLFVVPIGAESRAR